MSQIPPVIPLDGKSFSYSSESNPKEESSQCLSTNSSIISSSNCRQQQNLSSQTCNISLNNSGNSNSSNETNLTKQTDIETIINNYQTNKNMFSVTYSTNNDDLSFEEHNSVLNELTDNVNLSSLSFLQTKQRKIDHRRNKSEPVIPIINVNFEDNSSINSYKRPTIFESSSTSTTSNESAIISNSSVEKKRKSSKKQNSLSKNLKNSIEDNNSSSQLQEKSSSSSSSTTTTTKKKKSWYNVS